MKSQKGMHESEQPRTPGLFPEPKTPKESRILQPSSADNGIIRPRTPQGAKEKASLCLDSSCEIEHIELDQ